MNTTAKINVDEVLRRFKEIEYSQLNNTFRQAIADSLEILKKATENNLRGTGVNVTGPIRKGDTTYNPLIKGVISEVSMDGTKGRVRIAAAKSDGYVIGSDGSFALKWFEQGTKERFRKGKGYTSKKTSDGKSYRKHRNKGGSTGMLPKSGNGYGFFNKAYNSTINQVNKTLEDNINKAIQQILG